MRPAPSRLAPLALAVLTLGAACLQGARAPNVAPRGTLAPGDGEAALGRTDGPFGVVFAAPKGPTVDPSEITIVWNRPMRALDVAGQEAPAPVTLSPAARGHWVWVGTTGVVFNADGQLPSATDFTVTVPAGTKALDGSTLEKPYILRFSTARPKLEYVDADPGAQNDLRPSSKLALRFNQPIDDGEILRSVHVAVGDEGKNVPFEIKRPDKQNDKRVELVPKVKLPLDTPVHVRVDKGLRGREGPLASTEEQVFDFRTYGPLAVLQVTCNRDTPNGKCASDSGLSLELSNPVKFGDLKRAIKIQPPIKIRWPAWLEDETTTTSVAIWGRFSPGKSYTVQLSNTAVRDVHGQALARPFSGQMAFDHLWPTAEIGLMGSVFEPSARRAIPIASVNVRELEVATAPLDRASVFAIEGDDKRAPHSPGVDDIRRMNGGKVATIRPGAGVNRAAQHPVNPDEVLGGKDKRGPLAIAISYIDRPGTRHARRTGRGVVAQVTDLAISAKVSPHGSLVWITRLSSAAPVAGASVSIARADNAQPEIFTTDASGFALVPPTAFTPVTSGAERGIIFAKLGDDWTYRRVGDAIGSWRLGASVDLGPDRPFGMMFTDRGIYRPGETVRMKGIFREEARVGTKTPAGRVVDVSVSGPDGEVIQKASQALSPFGTIAIDVKVPDVGRLGTYGVSASVQGSPRDYPDVTADFEVAEFRAAEFQVSVASSRPSYVRGDRADWSARADYLFGAPMAGADVWTHVTRAETSFTPPGLDGFVTEDEAFLAGRPDASTTHEEVANNRSRLDSKGSVSVGAALAMPGQDGPELVTCEAEVTDLSRQVIAGSTTAIVHPGEFYVALKPGADLFVKATDPIKPEVLTVEPKGTRVTGVPVTIELVQRRWSVARQQVGGGHRSVTSVDDKVVSTCTVTSGAAPVSCALQPPGVGYYLIHATAKDKRGNPVASSSGIYATGDAGETSWGDTDRRSVELVPDRKSYDVGQIARVLVKSPFKSAEALVTVERAGVYTKRRVTLSGPMPTIDVPITEDLRPNAFVSVLLVRGRSKPAPNKPGAADVGAPSYRAGYASLPVNPEARRLTLALKANRTELRPGDPIEVDVDVKDRAGKPARAEVTLYAVDEGVLSLVGYKTPDPIPVFGAPRSLKVATIEARDAIARVLNPLADLGLDKGLDGGGGGESAVRRDFRASAYWSPTLVTDDKGHVHVSFKLPDALTTYRLMAVAAAEDDRFGYAQDRVVTSRPLMARPAFPRFLRAGDQIDAGVILTSKGLPKAKIDVEIAAEGLVVKGDAKRSIDLDANGSAEVRFTLDAPKAGQAKVRFKAKGGGSEDVVEIVREVKVPLSLEAVALYGDTTQAMAERLGDLSAIRDDTGGLDVSLSSTALVGLGSGAEQLIDYPYGCTEQLTSKLVPMLPLRDLAEAYKVNLPKDTDRVIARTIADILTRQRGDGSFGLWADSPEGSPWVTAYTLWGLDLAKKHKAQVPDAALDSATAYLRANLALLDRDPILLATGPFILDVLAERGSPDPGRVSQLFDKRDKLPLFSQAQLLHAAVLSKSDPASIEKLTTEIEGHVRLDANVARAVANTGNHYAVLMDSEERTSAIVLRGLMAARPSHPLASKLAMGLLASRKGGTWRNTQEAAWSLLALDDYRKVQEKTEPDFIGRVFLGEAELFSAPFHGRSLDQARKNIPAANLVSAVGAPLAFDVDGKGRLFYEARLRYAKKALPKQGLERGFYVKKTLRAVTAEALGQALQIVPQTGVTSFKGGDLVLVDIVVVTPSPREFVVIDDPLAAGMEAVDAKLATTAGSMNVDKADAQAHDDDDDEGSGDEEDERAAGRGYLPNRFLREIRDDRVLFFVDHMSAGMFRYRYLARATTLGSFVVPPTKAEEMYTPEVFGRTGAEVIRVLAK